METKAALPLSPERHCAALVEQHLWLQHAWALHSGISHCPWVCAQCAGTKPRGKTPPSQPFVQTAGLFTHFILQNQIPVWLFLIPTTYVHVAGLWTLHGAA